MLFDDICFENYPFNAEQNIFWRPIRYIQHKDILNTKKHADYNETNGKQSASVIFYENKLDSQIVKDKLTHILLTMHNLVNTIDIEHVKNLDFVASYLLKYIIQNTICDISHIYELLDYLISVSRYLSFKIGNPISNADTKKIYVTSYITRSSYKFCEYVNTCQYNYPIKHKHCKGCFADHFVYNKLHKDCESLKFFIEFINNKNTNTCEPVIIRANKEIVKCINTIHVVVKHMYDELWELFLTYKDDYELYHRNINSQQQNKFRNIDKIHKQYKNNKI